MRLFVCDPVCVLPFGHNAVALDYFGKALGKHFSSVALLCCKHLPDTIVKQYGFSPFYEFYYPKYLKVPGLDGIDIHERSNSHHFSDPIEALATRDAQRMLATFAVSAKDTIFFPGADFYGVAGLLNALADKDAADCPELLLRFIGVMEHATSAHREPMRELGHRICDACESGLRIRVSAETPTLAHHLADALQIEVATTPYLDVHPQLPMPAMGAFVVYCPGSARGDKGFFRLLEIFSSVRRMDRKLAIRFVAQSLPISEATAHQKYISHLYAVPGTELLPSVITYAEMVERYRQSSAVLLPYEPDIYRMRGSAAMMEAACFGRPTISIPGTAFAEQIQWYRLGTIAPTIADIPKAIVELSREPAESIERRASRVRAAFIRDVKNAYSNWFGVEF
jgi:hypothetical protein